MKRAILIPIIILFFLSSCDTVLQVKEGRVHLIIVALDYSNTNYVSNLIGPIDDAKEIGACLESHYTERNIPFEAIYLMAEGSMANEKDECYPSAENIISVIQNLTVHKEDLIVFYYSGHGALYEDSESKAYLVTGMTRGIPNGLYQDNNDIGSNTAGLVELMKYIMWRYSGIDYGVTDFNMINFMNSSLTMAYGGDIIVKVSEGEQELKLTRENIKKAITSTYSGKAKDNLLSCLEDFYEIQTTKDVNAIFAIAVTVIESSAGTDWDLIDSSTYNWYSIQRKQTEEDIRIEIIRRGIDIAVLMKR